MDKAGFSYRRIAFLRSFLHGFVPCTAYLCAAGKSMTYNVGIFLPIYSSHLQICGMNPKIALGQSVSLIRMLQLVVPEWAAKNEKAFPVDPRTGEVAIEVKVSLDGRQVRKNKTLRYTSVVFTITQDGFDERYQSPFFTYLISEYKGPDERKFFDRNLQDLKANLEYLDKNTIPVKIGDKVANARVTVLLPADMKAHWAWFRTGGMHDKGGFCHRCHADKADRQTVFEITQTKVRQPIVKCRPILGVAH
jgi:hypothetical protein